MSKVVDLLNTVYDKYKEYFQQSDLHNVLWQVMINKVHEDVGQRVLIPVTDMQNNDIRLALGVKGQPGVIVTPANFSDGMNLKDAKDIVTNLNRDIFFLTKEEQTKIAVGCGTR